MSKYGAPRTSGRDEGDSSPERVVVSGGKVQSMSEQEIAESRNVTAVWDERTGQWR